MGKYRLDWYEAFGRKFIYSTITKENKIEKVMKKELNLVEKLKNVPEGTEFYHTTYGTVFFSEVKEEEPVYKILFNKTKRSDGYPRVTSLGKMYDNFDGECVSFPSKTQRNWNLFYYAKAKEYVTVISLDESGDKYRHICQVASDGVFDEKNSIKLLACGIIKGEIIEIREATKEEVEELIPKPRFKKGDIVILDGKIGVLNEEKINNENQFSVICFRLGGAYAIYNNNLFLLNNIKLASYEDAKKLKLELKEKYNRMIDKDGDIVRWRASVGEMFHLVEECGGIIESYKDEHTTNYNTQYAGGNYFATKELAEASPLYKCYIR